MNKAIDTLKVLAKAVEAGSAEDNVVSTNTWGALETFLKTTLIEPDIPEDVVESCDLVVDEILQHLESLSSCGEKLFSLLIRLSFFYGTCERTFLILAKCVPLIPKLADTQIILMLLNRISQQADGAWKMAKLACVLVESFDNQKHEACKMLLKASFGPTIGDIIVQGENFTLQCYLIELLNVTIPPRKHTTGDPFITGLFQKRYSSVVWKTLPGERAASQKYINYIKDVRKTSHKIEQKDFYFILEFHIFNQVQRYLDHRMCLQIIDDTFILWKPTLHDLSVLSPIEIHLAALKKIHNYSESKFQLSFHVKGPLYAATDISRSWDALDITIEFYTNSEGVSFKKKILEIIDARGFPLPEDKPKVKMSISASIISLDGKSPSNSKKSVLKPPPASEFMSSPSSMESPQRQAKMSVTKTPIHLSDTSRPTFRNTVPSFSIVKSTNVIRPRQKNMNSMDDEFWDFPTTEKFITESKLQDAATELKISASKPYSRNDLNANPTKKPLSTRAKKSSKITNDQPKKGSHNSSVKIIDNTSNASKKRNLYEDKDLNIDGPRKSKKKPKKVIQKIPSPLAKAEKKGEQDFPNENTPSKSDNSREIRALKRQRRVEESSDDKDLQTALNDLKTSGKKEEGSQESFAVLTSMQLEELLSPSTEESLVDQVDPTYNPSQIESDYVVPNSDMEIESSIVLPEIQLDTEPFYKTRKASVSDEAKPGEYQTNTLKDGENLANDLINNTQSCAFIGDGIELNMDVDAKVMDDVSHVNKLQAMKFEKSKALGYAHEKTTQGKLISIPGKLSLRIPECDQVSLEDCRIEPSPVTEAVNLIATSPQRNVEFIPSTSVQIEPCTISRTELDGEAVVQTQHKEKPSNPASVLPGKTSSTKSLHKVTTGPSIGKVNSEGLEFANKVHGALKDNQSKIATSRKIVSSILNDFSRESAFMSPFKLGDKSNANSPDHSVTLLEFARPEAKLSENEISNATPRNERERLPWEASVSQIEAAEKLEVLNGLSELRDQAHAIVKGITKSLINRLEVMEIDIMDCEEKFGRWFDQALRNVENCRTQTEGKLLCLSEQKLESIKESQASILHWMKKVSR